MNDFKQRSTRAFSMRVLALCLVMLVCVPIHAQQPPVTDPAAIEQAAEDVGFIPQCYHEWGRFGKGAWKRVRILTETLDENGNVTRISTNETTITLIGSDQNSATLRIDVTVVIAGKRFPKQPRIVEQSFGGIPNSNAGNFETLKSSKITINGKEIPVEVRRTKVTGEESNQTCTISFSDLVSPYVLRREVEVTDNKGEKISSTVSDVVATELPYRIFEEMKPATFLRTCRTNDSGSTVTLEVHSEDIPGGVVAHTTKEISAQGKVIRRSTLELIDFHPGDTPRRGVLRRRERRKGGS